MDFAETDGLIKNKISNNCNLISRNHRWPLHWQDQLKFRILVCHFDNALFSSYLWRHRNKERCLLNLNIQGWTPQACAEQIHQPRKRVLNELTLRSFLVDELPHVRLTFNQLTNELPIHPTKPSQMWMMAHNWDFMSGKLLTAPGYELVTFQVASPVFKRLNIKTWNQRKKKERANKGRKLKKLRQVNNLGSGGKTWKWD